MRRSPEIFRLQCAAQRRDLPRPTPEKLPASVQQFIARVREKNRAKRAPQP